MSAHAAWAHPQLAAQVLRPRAAGRSEIALRIAPLHDARHVVQLEQRITALPGVQRVAIDALARRVRVVWDRQCTSLPQLLDAFAAGQCNAQPLRHDSIEDTRAAEMHTALKRLLVAGMCAMQVMSYALVLYVGAVDFIDFTTRGLFRWLSLLTTAPIVFYSAQPFFRGARDELRQRRMGINLPVALAVALVFAASTFTTVIGSGEIYFDSVSMFVFLLLGGRYLELRSRHRSGALGDAVLDATPWLAQRRRADSQLETVAAIELVAGDRVHIAEGETIPADGTLESAAVRVDEALLSGEARPVWRQRGEPLLAGTVLLTGPADMRVEHAGGATASARLGALATRIRNARTPISADHQRDVARFVSRILLLTALTALGWLLVDPGRAFSAAVAVLVVACPCAFALTMPATLTRALGALARRGVLVTNSAALTALAHVNHAWFDKTGTLTTPQLSRANIEPLRGDGREQVLQWAAALAYASSHPLARALSATASQHAAPLHATGIQVTAGGGISGTLESRPLWLGNAVFALLPSGVQVAANLRDALVLADATGAIAAFHLHEQAREDAAHTLHTLRATGVTCAIASGDAAPRVAALAAQLQVDEWHAAQTADDKLALLQASHKQGATTLAVGDGSNDAALLAAADVSVALASGTSLAQAHADLLLLDGGLDGLLQARAIARQVLDISAQSRRWALVYNLCAVPFAAFGLVSPWLAGIGMSLSSLGVVLNTLRVGRNVADAPPVPPA
jgi:ATPase, P-type (transporting), HAD superfamily, subfamily IC/heavy metal translocating P-type ATPase